MLRASGYTVAQAVVPPQEIAGGQLEIKVYVAAYDEVRITQNTSDVADSVLQGYLYRLKQGEVMTDRELELAMNNLNDLPGVTARAVLRPGREEGTTSVDVEVERRPVWNNYVFTDNGGGYYSGRYRYGFHTEINNPGGDGDKVTLSGMMSSHDVQELQRPLRNAGRPRRHASRRGVQPERIRASYEQPGILPWEDRGASASMA